MSNFPNPNDKKICKLTKKSNNFLKTNFKMINMFLSKHINYVK